MLVLLTSIGIGLSFGVAIYLLLSSERRIWLLGLTLLTTITNGILFLLSRPNRVSAPFLGARNPGDPLPQALILTAIVIGLALLVTAVLSTRTEEN